MRNWKTSSKNDVYRILKVAHVINQNWYIYSAYNECIVTGSYEGITRKAAVTFYEKLNDIKYTNPKATDTLYKSMPNKFELRLDWEQLEKNSTTVLWKRSKIRCPAVTANSVSQSENRYNDSRRRRPQMSCELSWAELIELQVQKSNHRIWIFRTRPVHRNNCLW